MKEAKVPCPKCGTAVTSKKGDWMIQWQCKTCGLKNFATINSQNKPLPLRMWTASAPQKTQDDVKKPSRQKKAVKRTMNKREMAGFSVMFLLAAIGIGLIFANLLIPNPVALFLVLVTITMIVLILWLFDWGGSINK
jgi:DNA-directed RNA polymerase subunit M/transcription elongation factor TFIIS